MRAIHAVHTCKAGLSSQTFPSFIHTIEEHAIASVKIEDCMMVGHSESSARFSSCHAINKKTVENGKIKVLQYRIDRPIQISNFFLSTAQD